ncbi:MAG: BatD family protein [Hyphomicrobiales bacterium]
MTGSEPRGTARVACSAALVALLVAIAPRGAVAAGSLAISAAVDPPRIAVGEQAQLTVEIRADGVDVPHYALPSVPGLNAVRVADSQSFSWVNGRLTRSSTTQFILSAPAPGQYTIPPIRIAAGLIRAESRPVTLVVQAAGTAPPSASLPPPAAGGGAPPDTGAPPRVWGDQSAPDLFVRLIVDRRRAYWNQQITARYVFYTRVPLDQAPTWEIADAPGFWKETLGDPRRDRVRVGNQEYVSFEQDVAYFPTRPGKLTIGPGDIEARVVRRVSAPDPWSLLGFPETEVRSIPLQTERAAIDVRPLPTGAPAGFQGAVGSLAMKVNVDRLITRVGEPFTVTTVLSGDGNLNAAGDPDVRASVPLRSYETGGAATASRSGLRIHGERRHEIAFVPEVPGTIDVLPVQFTWFDPEVGGYRTQRSDSIHVRVLPAGASGDTLAAAAEAGPPATLRARSGPTGPLDLGPPAGAAAVALASALGFAGAFLVGRSRRLADRDPRVRKRRALLALEAAAGRASGSGPRGSAAASVAPLLPLALGVRFDADVEGRPREEALRIASEHGAPDAWVSEARRLSEALEHLAFAPADARGEADAALREAAAFLARLREERP